MNRLEELFRLFLTDETNKDEIIYSLTQSTVEPIICFKFGSWLSKKNISNINILELYNIDLIIGIDKDLFFMEFGHLLNLLKHDTKFSKRKVVSDCEKLPKKIKSFGDRHRTLVEEKTLHKVTIGLFSDFKGTLKENRFGINYNGNLKTGTFMKYGVSKKDNNYFGNYTLLFRDYGYTETVIIPNEISLWWKIQNCD